ncbi:MAG: NACHT domain-containing protein [Cyanothece sp. SIO1E1]|nr:NACHT domain-containing protein [Cyanothece sp. SIO1E1]
MILIYLRNLRDVFARKSFPSLPELITQHHLPRLPNGESLQPPPNWSENLLRQGKALVMLDGFDEVAKPQRDAVSTWISEQMRRYPQTVFILTSRPPGYQDYAAVKPETTVFVRAFNPQQRQQFIQQWYRCQESYDRGGRKTPDVWATADQKAESLIQQLEQRQELADMSKNPLLLNMIATFHRFHPYGELPQQRAALYRDICKLQLEDRPKAKGMLMALSSEQSQEVLQGLALAMMQHPKGKLETFSLGQGKALIQKILTRIDDTVTADLFLEQIVKISELLVEKEHQIYEFAHLSFQEYLAAAQIKQLRRESLLLQHLEDDQWRETILLYTAQVNPTNLIQQACQMGTRKAVALAYDCLRESPRKVDPSLTAELESLAVKLQVLRYRDLERYLKNGQWKEADNETYRVMIQTVGKEEGQWFEEEDLLNFPCDDLKQIDQLWVKYSNGKFGFSVQKRIYLEVGGIPDGKYYEEAFEKFGDRVAWRVHDKWISYNCVTFDTSGPEGHLPCHLPMGWSSFGRLRLSVFSSLASRLVGNSVVC